MMSDVAKSCTYNVIIDSIKLKKIVKRRALFIINIMPKGQLLLLEIGIGNVGSKLRFSRKNFNDEIY